MNTERTAAEAIAVGFTASKVQQAAERDLDSAINRLAERVRDELDQIATDTLTYCERAAPDVGWRKIDGALLLGGFIEQLRATCGRAP